MLNYNNTTARKIAHLFKIKLNSTSKGQVLRFLRENLSRFEKEDNPHHKFLITTPNPEQVLLANTDQDFARIINRSTFSLPDGVGLIQAIKFLTLAQKYSKGFFRPIALFFQGLRVGAATFLAKEWLESEIKLIHGREMMLEIIKLANKKGWRIVFLGGCVKGVNVASKAAQKLARNYKKVKLIGFTGPQVNSYGLPVNQQGVSVNKEIMTKINEFRPHILFVGMTPPKQEKWIAKNLSQLRVGGVMVVGGAFDYVSGVVKKTPFWINKLELEWIWRLLTQKGRVRRVLTAFPIFPLKVYLSAIRG